MSDADNVNPEHWKGADLITLSDSNAEHYGPSGSLSRFVRVDKGMGYIHVVCRIRASKIFEHMVHSLRSAEIGWAIMHQIHTSTSYFCSIAKYDHHDASRKAELYWCPEAYLIQAFNLQPWHT